VCTRIYRFFHPERDEESYDSFASSSSLSARHRLRNCFGAGFPVLRRNDTRTISDSGGAITILRSGFSFLSPLSLRRTRRESNGRLSFSSVESGEFNFESGADIEGQVHKRSKEKLEGSDEKGGGDDDKTKPEIDIAPVLSVPPSPSSSTPSSSSSPTPARHHLDPPRSLSSRFLPFRLKGTKSTVGRDLEIAFPLPAGEGNIEAESTPTRAS
jgi:hypothetical protein